MFFDRLHGQIDITFQDNLAGMNDATLADAANYSFSKVHLANQKDHIFLVNVISVTPNFNGLTENVVLTLDHGQPIREILT